MIRFFRAHPLMLIIGPFSFLCATSSFLHFMVLDDYTIGYEVECSPVDERCFEGCRDDECTDVYYYYLVEKTAKILEKQCGQTIVGCTKAERCLLEDGDECSILYCNPQIATCYEDTASHQSKP